MYDYYDEMNKVRAAIDTYITRVKAGTINIPVEELSDGQTGVEWAADMLHYAINYSVRQ